MKFHFLVLLISTITIFSFCDSKKEKIDTSANITPIIEKEIIIYGSENCDHCIEFRDKADSLKIKYVFKDAEKNEAYYNELVQKIQGAGIPGYISFPVVEIDEKLYIRPEFNKFLSLISD
jgi:glutaredoxin